MTHTEVGLISLRDLTKLRPGSNVLIINMPRMNGVEFLKHLKGDPKISSLPVAVLTTSKDEADWFNPFSKNVAVCMIKPVDCAPFVEVMRKIRDYWMASGPTHCASVPCACP